jgi:predicted RNase H-like HicB family nuclease
VLESHRDEIEQKVLCVDLDGDVMNLTIELEEEDDGRWIAEVMDLPGVLAYGQSREEAVAHAKALALRVLADRIEHGEGASDFTSVSFLAA